MFYHLPVVFIQTHVYYYCGWLIPHSVVIPIRVVCAQHCVLHSTMLYVLHMVSVCTKCAVASCYCIKPSKCNISQQSTCVRQKSLLITRTTELQDN